MSLGSISVVGESNQQYEFQIFQWGTSFKALGGVYLVTKAVPNDRGSFTHDIIYVGETEDLSKRFDNHHRQKCFDSNGKNRICVLVENSSKKRLEIETDIRRYYDPDCNRQ